MVIGNMILRSWVLATAIGFASLLVSVDAWAACSGSSIDGKWQAYFRVTNGVSSAWLACALTVRPGGSISPGTDCGIGAPGGVLSSGFVTGGRISVKRSCEVTGKFEFFDCEYKIDGGWMAKDRIKLAGLGTNCAGSVFDYSAIKR